MTEALTPDDVTQIDTFTLTETQEKVTDLPGVKHLSRSDVWATFRAEDATNFHAILETINKQRGVVVYKAEYSDKSVSIALEKFADEL